MRREGIEVLDDPRSQRGGGIAIVMEMKLDLAVTGARELGETIEKVRSIFFAGEEPAVARRSTVAVAKARRELRVALGPGIDTRASDLVAGTAPQRLVVIAQREQHVARPTRSRRANPPNQVARVVGQPRVQVLFTKAFEHSEAMLLAKRLPLCKLTG
jgi:hypothetical protein